MSPLRFSKRFSPSGLSGTDWGRRVLATGIIAIAFIQAVAESGAPIELGSRRELFVDRFLIDRLDGAALRLHAPRLAARGKTPRPSGHYSTVIKDGDRYRLYYRGDKIPGVHWRSHGWDVYHANEVTLYAESRDGIEWVEPDLGLYQVERYPKGNVVLADASLVTHNFSPFIDTRPDVPAMERYKALGGLRYPESFRHLREKHGPGGLKAFISGDGVHWKPLQEAPVIPEEWGGFDSQNVAFWSATEQCYVCYFRTIERGLRSIARTTSTNFLDWTPPVPMNANAAGEHLYTSGTHPYFRAPQIYIALPTRFQANRGSTTDILFMTSRGAAQYDRTFMEAFIRPGLGKDAWEDRANYAAWHVVPTSSTEMSIFLVGDRRYVLRLDGFVSVNAPWAGGEVVTKPLTFLGKELEINYSTSAGGAVRVEIQDPAGEPLPGFALEDCPEIVGDEIERVVSWKAGKDIEALAGKPIRLRFVMQDADLFSLRFR